MRLHSIFSLRLIHLKSSEYRYHKRMTAGQVLEYGALVSRRDELRQLQENEEVTAELNLIEERIKELGFE